MNPDPAGFDDPESGGWGVIGESIDQCVNENPHSGEEIVRTTEDHQARSSFGREPEHIGKVQIEGHQNVAF